MDCPACKRSLLNVTARQCPECAAPFVPSQFVFTPGAVRFCCPHCDQGYAGTGARGELVPRRFNCLRCARSIDMDEMVVRMTEPVGGGGESGGPVVAPPITAGPISIRAEAPAWPTVIGIIAIVLGAGGVLGGLWGILTPFVMGRFKGLAAAGGPDIFAGITRWGPWLSVLSGVSALVAGMLLLGGIGMAKRRGWSGRMLVAWAIAKVLFAIPMVIVTALMQRDQMSAAFSSMGKNSTPPPPGLVGAMSSGIMVVTVVLSLAWYWAFPLFVLIWLARRPHRALMATWGANQV